MPITNRDRQELEEFYNIYKAKYQGKKEDYFALVYLTKKFKCEVTDIAHQVAFGNYDFGIDAYYLDRAACNLYLYQFKWSDNHNLFKESFERLLNTGLSVLFGSGSADPNENEYIRHFKADIHECNNIIDRVYFHMVFKGDEEKADASKGLSYDKEIIEQNKKHVIEQAFGGRSVEVVVEFISDKRRPSKPPLSDTFQIRFKSSYSLQTQDGTKTMHVGFLPLNDLYQIYLSLEHKLLERNIRSVLDSDNPPNKKIRAALSRIVLKGEESAELFPFYHNGITLAAEKLEFLEDGAVKIKVPRLLNGAQTISSFGEFVEENSDNITFKQNKHILEDINVLAKIIISELPSDFITAVTISNNQQNRVEPWNLRANDKIQCLFEDKFMEEANIIYERQENAFDSLYNSLSDEEKENLADSRKAIKIQPLAKTFLAVQGEIDKISHPRDVFENQKYYEDCFKESYLDSNVRRIILAYKVQFVINNPMKKLEESSPQWLSKVILPSKSLIWALLIQGMFNDEKKLSSLLDFYTENLTNDQGLRDYLSTLANSKLVALLRDVLREETYKRQIEDEKYSFLRSKAIYKKCMDEAFDKFGWKKLPL